MNDLKISEGMSQAAKAYLDKVGNDPEKINAAIMTLNGAVRSVPDDSPSKPLIKALVGLAIVELTDALVGGGAN